MTIWSACCVRSRHCSVPRTCKSVILVPLAEKRKHDYKSYWDWLGKSCRFIPGGCYTLNDIRDKQSSIVGLFTLRDARSRRCIDAQSLFYTRSHRRKSRVMILFQSIKTHRMKNGMKQRISCILQIDSERQNTVRF